MHAGHSRQPELTNAYILGGGIASLAAAVHLLHDAHIPPSQIHVLEARPPPAQCQSGIGSPHTGYVLRGRQMLSFSYKGLCDLLSTIPSLTDPAKTVMQEIDEFNAMPRNKTHANARLVVRGADGPQIVDAKHLQLGARDRFDLALMAMGPEKRLGTRSIKDCFQERFFRTNFWLMWATMFAFQPWHSAVEFRRYLRRFTFDISRINTLEGLSHTPYNQYDSVILPIQTYLTAQGVDFQYDTKVSRLSFAERPGIKVEKIHFSKNDITRSIQLDDLDIVFLTLGSMAACTSVGSNHSPPAPLPSVHDALIAPDRAWELWASLFWSSLLNTHASQLGNPKNFYSRVKESNLLYFTVTLKDPEFFVRFEKWSGNPPGTGGMTTFRDSSWLMSIAIPHQPYFLNQPDDIQVFWGYALSAERTGDVVRKPMVDCTGQEILTELLGLLDFPEHPILENAITIPCVMPFMTSPFLTRRYEDRPEVIPKGSINLALLGQFVEVPGDIVLTGEYGVQAAQTAVFQMMGVQKKPRTLGRKDRTLST